MSWKLSINKSFDSQGLSDLFENKYGAIILEDFLSDDESLKIIDYLKYKNLIAKYDYNFNEADAPEALHFMTTHYLFEENKDKRPYLLEAKSSIEDYRQLVSSTKIDVLDKLHQLIIKSHFSVNAASENSDQYSQCMIRSLKEGALLHADYAPFLEEDWSIKNILSELAWNVFLEVPEAGGECVIYNLPWEKEHDEHIVKGTYGYDESLVTDKDFVKISVKKGSLVLFNSRNFHKVLASKGRLDRITIGGHLGLLSESSIISWV